MPDDIAVGGFAGHALVLKTEGRIECEQFRLAGQHKAPAALRSGIGDGAAEQGAGVSVPTVGRGC